VANNVDTGAPTVTASEYDPQVEFLEIGVNVNGTKAWKVYGPDLNGTYGGLQGTGGLEAVVMNSGGAATGVLNDYFGNGVATVSGGAVTWNTTHVASYGPLPDSAAQPLTSITQLASAMAWRGHRIDGTGFYNLGARYYEPTSGRFLSCDPLSFAAGTDLYTFCNGDCVNSFDPDGRGKVDTVQLPDRWWDTSGPNAGGGITQGAASQDPNNNPANEYNGHWFHDLMTWWGGQQVQQAEANNQRVQSEVNQYGPYAATNMEINPLGMGIVSAAKGTDAFGNKLGGSDYALIGATTTVTAVGIYSVVSGVNAVNSQTDSPGQVNTVTRYVGPNEAQAAQNTGFIPNVDAAGNPKDVYVTPEPPMANAGQAASTYQINTPTHVITGDASNTTFNYGGNVENGTGIELRTTQQIPVISVTPLAPSPAPSPVSR